MHSTSQSDTGSDVLIVGAGPTGLVLALWLTKLGVRVRIIDKTAAAGTTSRAVAVQARTLELYRQVGLAAAVVEAGVKVEGVDLWIGGASAARAPLGRFGERLSPYPYALTYGQDEHERLLVERLGAVGVCVERLTELLRLSEEEDRVRAVIRRPDGSQEDTEAPFIAGCDGAHSTVREALGIDFPGGTYTGAFYVADVIGEGLATNCDIHVDLEEADFMAAFPLKGSGRLRLIGPVTWKEPGAQIEPSVEYIRERAARALKLEVSAINWSSTYRVHHRVAERFREGRVFLLGDAAHIHSPVGGQGMNTGIGDAVNIAWKLAAVLHSKANDSLLDSYQPERMAFAWRLVATTDRAFTVITKQGPLARWVRTRMAPRFIQTLLRLPYTQRLLFRTVSQIGVNYRASPLSEGAAGRIRAGDRLPWVTISSGSDNFKSLESLHWQVHVYGDVAEGLCATCAALGLPLHHFAWRETMASAGLSRDALYLIRPDGYAALADPRADPIRLRQYLNSRGIDCQPIDKLGRAS